MVDVVVILILVAVIGSAVGYIIREKKRGAKCIGCSACKSGGGCSGCAFADEKK